MQLVFVNQPGTPIAPVRDLTMEEIGALHSVTCGTPSSHADALVQSIWRQRQWIACSCRGPTANPSLMYVHRSYLGDFTLSTMPDRPPHADGCVLAADGVQNAGLAKSDGRLLPPLARLMVRWIAAARLNVLYPYASQDLLSRQYAGLRDAARSLTIAPGRSLYDYSRTHPDALPNLVLQLQRTQNQIGPVGAEEAEDWGLLLVVAAEVIEGGLKVGGDLVQHAANQIESRAGTLDIGGPYAALLKYGIEPKGAVRLRQVFLQAVYSPYRLVPIDAPQQRRTLKTLLRLQQKLLAETELLVVIRKTLPGTQAYDRGIAFRLQRLGPNGQPVHDIDILSIDAADRIDSPFSRSTPKDVIYHLVKQGEVLHDLDRRFFNIVFARLHDGVPARPQARSPAVNSSPQ